MKKKVLRAKSLLELRSIRDELSAALVKFSVSMDPSALASFGGEQSAKLYLRRVLSELGRLSRLSNGSSSVVSRVGG